MARNNELVEQRNERLRKRYNQLCEGNPHWKYMHIVDVLAKEFFIMPATVMRILKS